MTSATISFRVDEETSRELRELSGGRSLSHTIRDVIHEQYRARLYAAADAERLRNDPDDLAEIRELNDELDQIIACRGSVPAR
jgi:hypothetical protein